MGPARALSIFALLVAGPAGAQHDHHAMRTMPAMAFDPATARLDFALEPLEGDVVVAGEEVRVRLQIADAAGRPVTGQSVAGWMILRRNAQVAAEMSCKAKAKLFTQGRVTARPDVDLNAARMLILGRDGTIGIANPQIDFTITQLEGVVPLPGVPADWALSGETLFVTLPVYGALAVIDARGFKMTGLAELGAGSMPTQVHALPDGRVAAFLSGTGSVAIAGPGERMAPVAVGPGPVAMAVDGATLYVAAADGTLSVIDTETGRTVASARLASGAPSLAVAAGRVFAASADGDTIAVLEANTLVPEAAIAVERGVFAMAADPAGGHVLAVNRATGMLLLIDAGSAVVVARSPVARDPVEIAFSHDYAYVRGLGGDHFTVAELAEIGRGRIAPTNVQSASRALPPREALSRARLVAPYGHGALVANPDEAVAYYYMEGMNTPMGTVKTYGPNVQGIMTVDRGFRETAPGLYETTAVLPFGGTYDVPVAIDTDGAVTCFTAVAEPAAKTAREAARASVRIEAEPPRTIAVATPGRIVFRITDTGRNAPATGLRDVRLLAFSSGGTWQARKRAVDLGGGRYAADWTFPKAGRYGVSLAVASRDLGFADTAPVYLDITDTSGSASGGTRRAP